MWGELLIHFQTSTVQPLKFGNGKAISSHTLLCDYTSMLRLKLIHNSKRGPSGLILNVLKLNDLSHKFRKDFWPHSGLLIFTLSNHKREYFRYIPLLRKVNNGISRSISPDVTRYHNGKRRVIPNNNKFQWNNLLLFGIDMQWKYIFCIIPQLNNCLV